MALVTVDQAQPGMVLAEGVTDKRGRLLIPAGNELSERHVGALKMWGVTHLEIEGDGPEGDDLIDIDPEVLARAEHEVDEHLGKNNPEHPFIAALRGRAVRQHAAQLASRGNA